MSQDDHKKALEAAYEAFARTPVKTDPLSFVFIVNDDEQRQIAAACAAYVAALSAMPPRELLAEALDALEPFAAQTRASGPTEERNIRRARAAADKIRAALEHQP
jgi:hypothetical protein